MSYKIIGSGSSGNSVEINQFLFDIGLPFKQIKDELFNVRYVLISHVHSDHLNLATYRQIKKKFPVIKFVGNEEVNIKAPMDIIAHDDETMRLGNIVVTPFKAPHDVDVCGWTWKQENEDYLFVTDTYTMKFAPDHKYDHFFLEANHDQNKINQIMGNDKKLYGYSAVDGALRHLSTQDAKAFYYMHRKSKSSEWVQLHKSSRFY